MHMTTDSFIHNPCDDEEDYMALVCCHGDNGDLFLLARFPDEDEVDITFRDVNDRLAALERVAK